MKSLPAKKLIKVLEGNGFWVARQRGSHIIFKNQNGIMVPVPLHAPNRPLPIGTFLAIVKQSRLPKEAFQK